MLPTRWVGTGCLLVHRSEIDRHETRFALQIVRDQLGQKVWSSHRLDKPTSGLLLLGLTPEAASPSAVLDLAKADRAELTAVEDRLRQAEALEMIAAESMPGPLQELSRHAGKALSAGYVKPTKRIFDNSKISDHFAIIPTLQAPKALTEIEAKLSQASAAFDAAIGETDASQVDARWQDVCKVMNEELPWATMWVANRYGVASANLVDFVWTPAPAGGPFAAHPELWDIK